MTERGTSGMVEVNGRGLSAAVKRMGVVIPKKYGVVRLEPAGTDRMVLAYADDKVAMRQSLPVYGEFPATCAIAHRLLQGIPETDHIELGLTGEDAQPMLMVRNCTFEGQLRTEQLNDCVTSRQPDRVIDLPDEDVQALLDLVPYCATDESRVVITCIQMAGQNAAATDTHRLGVIRLSKEIDGEILVPARLVTMIRRLRAKNEPVQLLTAGNDHFGARFAGSGTEVWRKLHIHESQRYPSWFRVLNWLQEEYEIDRLEWLSAICRVLPFARSEPRMHLTANTQGRLGLCTVDVSNRDGGITTRVPISDGPEFKMTFNAWYLAEALELLEGDRVRVRIAGPENPMMLWSGGRFVVVMPMQVD